jgi:four helix bundle protein
VGYRVSGVGYAGQRRTLMLESRPKAPMQTYKELDVWKVAVDLVEQVYVLTRGFPSDERFGLIAQMRRAAVSIPANIAEGYGRSHRGDYLHHLSFARGSLLELETHLTIALRLGFAADAQVQPISSLLDRVGRMLHKLIDSLSRQES